MIVLDSQRGPKQGARVIAGMQHHSVRIDQHSRNARKFKRISHAPRMRACQKRLQPIQPGLLRLPDEGLRPPFATRV